jgi:hypothetical protein
MKVKPVLSTLIALAALVGGALVVYRWEAPRRPAVCQVCGRYISRETAYRLDTADGTINACCPACAMHYMLHHPDAVQKAWATDFNSGRAIPATSAYYDEGGGVQYCTRHKPPVERGTEGISQRVYDRCLPTLVAFATRDEAEVYRQKHGGRIVSYHEAMIGLEGQ